MPTTTIGTDKNGRYGPPLVTQKYRPLDDPAVGMKVDPFYLALVSNRVSLLTSKGLWGQQLTLAVPNWTTAVNAQLTNRPPLVVVSSNRAGWIKKALAAGDATAAALKLTGFDGPGDLRALTDPDGLGMSPPFYAPRRIGPNRSVYVVVHMHEYTHYREQLAGTSITPVGWSFDRAQGTTAGLNLVGFGASRFAAIEFCKVLLRKARTAAGHGPAPWRAAWLFDDNTVALTSFPGLVTVETDLVSSASPLVCSGFHGGTNAKTPSDNIDYARRELKSGRGQQTGTLPKSDTSGIVQQASVWNIDRLLTNNLNFSPLFISSAEDLSISKYFDRAKTGYRFFDGIGVVKEEPTLDNQAGATTLTKERAALIALVTDAEKAVTPQGTAPPPPILVQPVQPGDGTTQPLTDFIVKVVLGTSTNSRLTKDDPVTQQLALSHAVEQIICAALENGPIPLKGAGPIFSPVQDPYPVQCVEL